MFLIISIGIDPVAFSLGPIDVRWYGIGYVVAIAVGLWVILRYARERGLSTDLVWDVGSWAIPAGFIGGRLYYVVQNDFGNYLRHPYEMLQVWHGGMAYFGAILAVPVVIIIFALLRKGPLLRMLDVAAVFALVGQPIGRLGNVVNGDIIGAPSNLPWAFRYTNPDSFAPSTTVAYHPAAIYEIIANLILIGMLFPVRKRLPHGAFAALYLAGYCISQLIVFEWRSEPIVLAGLRQAQVTALVLLVLEAVVVFAYVRRDWLIGRFRPTPA